MGLPSAGTSRRFLPESHFQSLFLNQVDSGQKVGRYMDYCAEVREAGAETRRSQLVPVREQRAMTVQHSANTPLESIHLNKREMLSEAMPTLSSIAAALQQQQQHCIAAAAVVEVEASRMLRAGWVMVLTHYLLLLFLLALQAQNVQSAPVPGQRAAEAREDSSPAPQADSMLIPSWYLKRKDLQRIPVVPKGLLTALVKAASERDHEIVQKEILPMEEKSSMPGLDEETEAVTDTSTLGQHESYSERSAPGQKAETAGQWQLSKRYILTSIAVSAVLLLSALIGYTVMYQLLKRDVKNQGDEGVSTECNTFSFGDID
ncbi:uncharacterized protein LOC130265491 [Oenanthe melanoleuca]|uniref:uncharacterized protein LOC130265491 n=1 Tax=Oenanthe melanoleuca TaxID=2939378 RepID=UPI0024C1B7C5|nr:uncharacterized protein LOC130265491 [Oenanthe melanoleuca]